jgi:hypothetical protein
LRLLPGFLLILACAEAQDKISPLAQSGGGNVYVVVFQPGTDMSLARSMVQEQNFDLLDHPDLLPNHLLAAGGAMGLGALTGHEEVAYILPASPDLVAGNRVMACAGPVMEAVLTAQYVEVGRGWPRDDGGGVTLGYFLGTLTDKLPESTVRGEIERALREWQKYAQVTFVPADRADGTRTVAIQFARAAHGDSYPFDGRGGVLAHTFYPAPLNAEPIAGDIHLDADEDWHAGTNTDLFSVVLHEAGHALGLGHSDQPGSVMYPYYRMSTGLTADDIAGIQDLYGAPRAGTPPAPPATPPAPPVTPPAPPVTPPLPPVTPPAPPNGTPTSPDTTAPAIRIASPGTTIVSTDAASLAISGTASDDRGVAAVRWTTSNGDAGTASGTASWTASVPLLVGNTTVTVRAYDAAGNSSWRSITVVRR